MRGTASACPFVPPTRVSCIAAEKPPGERSAERLTSTVGTFARRPNISYKNEAVGESCAPSGNGSIGRCVSQWAHTEHQSRVSARSACTAEQADANFAAAHDGKSFDEYYGTGPQHRNGFGKCVLPECHRLLRRLSKRKRFSDRTGRCRSYPGYPGAPAYPSPSAL